MRTIIVIPSRYGSSRFEGKPLVDIWGKSLVRRTYEQAKKVNFDAEIIVATDDERIFEHVQTFGKCVMTSEHHISGTDRCFEVLQKSEVKYDIMINLQGDEPFIQPGQIEALHSALIDPDVPIATLQKPILETEDLFNTNIVKVISNNNSQAMYFSRHAIPYQRGIETSEWLSKYPYKRHLGMYGFRTEVCGALSELQAGRLEISESLEQLRWLENGYKIALRDTDFVSPAIDSPGDLLTVDNFLKMHPEFI